MKFFRFLSLQTCTQWHQWQSKSKCLDTSKGHFRTFQDSFFVYIRQVFTRARRPMAWVCFMQVLLHVATSLCHCTPSKPYSTSMLDLVVLARTCLNIMNWEFLNLNIVDNSFESLARTEARHGFPWFSVVINGFSDDGIAVPLGPLWFLPSWRRSW